MLGYFPAREAVRQWLKAGVIEPGGRFAPTEEGTPQGGVISPVMMNVALHGLEEAVGVRYARLGADIAQTRPECPVVVRYADDLVALCHSREQAEQVKARLAGWLAPRGLSFNEDKTRIVHLSEGFDFLGFNIRRYPPGKLLIKPSKKAIGRIRERLSAEFRRLRGGNAVAVLRTINPIVRGWAAYYRSAVSTEAFHQVDDHLWKVTFRWARRAHPNKPVSWVIARYFGQFNPRRADRWVFGDRDSGAYLVRLGWTKIVRHQLVGGTASPDDPALASYWAARRRRTPLPAGRATLRQFQAQQGRCPLCRGLLLHADQQPQSPHEWEQWLRAISTAVRKQAITGQERHGPTDDTAFLVHAHCQRRATAGTRNRASRNLNAQAACLSRGAGKPRLPGSEGAGAR
jgi:RNA-directed DNA polymerase